MRHGSLLAWLVLASCARVDVREGIPAQALARSHRARPLDGVVVAASLLGRLPPPPSLSGGLGSLVPSPWSELASSLPLVGALVGSEAGAAWMEDARRHDALTPRLVESFLGRPGTPLQAARPWWALSDESAAIAGARASGAAWLLWVEAAVGPDDGGDPLPGRLAAAAQVSLLDPWTGETQARAWDRVSIPVRGGRDALPATLRRCGSYLGQRLRTQVGLPPLPAPDDDGEDVAGE
ncbi:MAG: hypothetical protein HY904_12400 [Deltaproteobacteria bacterium]|nr:hypothetical protein [Deltaproteobacteria bacterium]